MRVSAEGTCGTPTQIRPPGFAALTISANRGLRIAHVLDDLKQQTAS